MVKERGKRSGKNWEADQGAVNGNKGDRYTKGYVMLKGYYGSDSYHCCVVQRAADVIDCSCMSLHDTNTYIMFKFIMIVSRIASDSMCCTRSWWHCNQRSVAMTSSEDLNKSTVKILTSNFKERKRFQLCPYRTESY